MGKGARARKHDERMKKKRAEKAAKRAKYAALAGTSSKVKKIIRRSQGISIYKHAHRMANCGNVGCKRCYPKLNKVA